MPRVRHTPPSAPVCLKLKQKHVNRTGEMVPWLRVVLL